MVLVPERIAYYVIQPITKMIEILRPMWVSFVSPLIQPLWYFISNILGIFRVPVILFSNLLSPIYPIIYRNLLAPLWTIIFYYIASPIFATLRSYITLPIWMLINYIRVFSNPFYLILKHTWTVISLHLRTPLFWLIKKLHELMMPKQLFFNLFSPIVNGLKHLLHRFPVPILTIVRKLAKRVFGYDSEEETAIIIVLSFTLTVYGSLILTAYAGKLIVFILFKTQLLQGIYEIENVTWNLDFEHHQLGALLLSYIIIVILLFQFIKLLLVMGRFTLFVGKKGASTIATLRSSSLTNLKNIVERSDKEKQNIYYKDK